MGLCWMCREFYEKRHIEIWPDDHCHHEEPEEKPEPEKSRCWCEHQYRQIVVSAQGKEHEEIFQISYCPNCGKKL